MILSESSTRIRASLCAQHLALAHGVLHLGAHIGHEAPKYAKANKPVVWVEAMPDIYEQLVARLRGFPGQRAVRALLGDVDGAEHTFFVSNNDSGVSSSLFQFGPRGSGIASLWPELDLHMVAELTLPMMTLDTLLRDNALDPADYDYWVVDLQGAELLALLGAPGALRYCRALYIEVSTVPVYDEAPLWPDLRDYVEAAGFVPMWEPELDHDDVLFVRGDRQRARDLFRAQDYLRHNEARLTHLASLDLDLRGTTVLEVGAGIGDHTGFYLERGCAVTITEVRPENLAILRERFADARNVVVRRLDLDRPADLGETFDVVHCYGILYHLEHPAEALAHLAEHCRALLLLETCVSFGEVPDANPVREPSYDSTQAYHGMGCRPTRPWVWDRLTEVMPFVYSTVTQPNHEEFPLDWSAPGDASAKLVRSVFVASRSDLSGNPNLTDRLPEWQRRLGCPPPPTA